MTIRRIANAAALILLSLFLLACSLPGEKPGAPTAGDTTVSAAESAKQALALAASSIAPDRQRHQLAAAKYLAAAGEVQQATELLAVIDQDPMDIYLLADYSLFYADLALQQDDFFLARDLLTNSRLVENRYRLNTDLRKHLLQKSGDLFALLGEDRTSLSAYLELGDLAKSSEELAAVNDRVWWVLTHIPQTTLQQYDREERNPVLKGWYSLAFISRNTQSDIRQLQQRLQQWQQQWPDHPAAQQLPSSLRAIGDIVSQLPTDIALLVPTSGALSQAGTTIRDGFIAARYSNYQKYGNTPNIRVYDTSKGEIENVYQQAVSDGANMIIGPLEKDKVRALYSLAELPVATIALNYIDDGNGEAEAETDAVESTTETPATGTETSQQQRQPGTVKAPAKLFQFGLSTTDEAHQIAERAWIEGQRSALAIVPDNNWGARVLEAFREQWLAKGGDLHLSKPYARNQIDFAPLLKPALHIDHSEERARRLERVLGKKLASSPRRRMDLDMVFMVAYPNHARQIKPTLDFLFAGDLQIYGTSQLYSGEYDLGRNRDLEGIRFSAMPWTLPSGRSDIMQQASTKAPLYRHMFALGADVYQLHQWLPQMQHAPATQLFGNTGGLQLRPDNTIAREQPWAVFRGGRVRTAQQLTDN